MAQDIISDGLNEIMNAKIVGKTELRIKRISKSFVKVLEVMKDKKHIDYSIEGTDKKPEVVVKILKLNKCKAIKPRFNVTVSEIDKYLRRFLPSRNFGTVIISTNKGLMDQDEAYENKIGGSLMAYFY